MGVPMPHKHSVVLDQPNVHDILCDLGLYESAVERKDLEELGVGGVVGGGGCGGCCDVLADRESRGILWVGGCGGDGGRGVLGDGGVCGDWWGVGLGG